MQAISFKTFKALGILLCYPTQEWQEGIGGLADLLDEEQLLSVQDREAIRGFIEHMRAQDLFDLQEAYVDQFDRVRSLSLHLFEHVHGESRDRGQAMVDLSELYKQHGFVLAESELPDFLPAFLEFLSCLSPEEALDMLGDPLHVIEALDQRLAERGSPYHVILDGLIRLLGKQPNHGTPIHVEMPSFEQLDKEWEEKPITFLGAEAPQASAGGCGGGSCGGCAGTASPQAM